jgi:hypothetical protein
MLISVSAATLAKMPTGPSAQEPKKTARAAAAVMIKLNRVRFIFVNLGLL